MSVQTPAPERRPRLAAGAAAPVRGDGRTRHAVPAAHAAPPRA